MSIEVTGTYSCNSHKWINYHCNVCGYDGSMRSDHYGRGVGCSVCAGKTVLKGYNDIATTYPDVAKYITPFEDAFSVTCRSHKKVTVKCDICGFERRQKVADLSGNGFHCKMCDKGNSFPNRIIASLLRHNHIAFKTEHTFKWSKKYRYDIFIPEHNTIIEMHGEQHYNDRVGWSCLEDVQRRDAEKLALAVSNGITNYYTIPAISSAPDYLRDSIEKSGVLKALKIQLDDAGWIAVVAAAQSSVARTCLQMWNGGDKDFESIGVAVGLSGATVYEYISCYSKMGLCDYEPTERKEKNRISANKAHRRPVICVNDGSVFESIKVASILRGVSESSIQNCLAGRTRSAGKDKYGNRLIWKTIT